VLQLSVLSQQRLQRLLDLLFLAVVLLCYDRVLVFQY
jgi:hypothetical protein